MEADWHARARVAVPPGLSSNSPASPFITSLAFDAWQDLLWIGTEMGRVTSFHGPELEKYTSYKGHVNTVSRAAPSNAPVKQLLLCEKGVISLSGRSIHFSSRRGLAQWHLATPDMHDLRCMSFLGKGSSCEEIVVAGCQEQMYRVNVETGAVLETIASPVPFTILRRSGQYICASGHDGSIHILDQKTLDVVRKWQAYAGTVNDMDARGDYLLTCGWAQQQHGGLGLERLVRVYDLKQLKPAAPMAFQQGAAFVRMAPKLSSTCIVFSEWGAISSIDVQNHDMPTLRYAQMFDALVTGLELMPSGRGFVMSDSQSHLVLWGSPSKLPFTEFSKPTEFADAPALSKHLDWAADLPFNLIGMPYYREALLSGWPNSLAHEVGAPPTKLEPALMATLRKTEHGMVGPNPRKSRRNQAHDTRDLRKIHESLAAPKFLSEKPRGENGDHEQERRLSEDIGKTLNALTVNGGSQADMLAYYRPVEIKYSKFGVDDFDFRYYNKTKYAGLETHIVNSYANPLLQLFRFTNVARNLILKHTAKDCRYESCLMCELGFLIDMLEKAQGQNCQATNFLKALSKQPGAASLAILEDHTINTPLTTMVQNLTRFMLVRLEDCFRRVSYNVAELHGAFVTRGSAFSRCMHCSYEDAKEQTWYSYDLVYPAKPPKHSPRPVRHSFTRLLQDSVHRYDQQRGYCNRCQGYKVITSRRVVHAMPAVLMINAAIHTPEARQLWATPGFLPREIGIINVNSQFYCYEGQDLKLHLQRRTHTITVYELVAVVADVAAGDAQKSHLVSIVDTSISDPDRSSTPNWHLVNDFLVRPIAQEEALLFDPRWKLPSVLTYQMKTKSHDLDESWKAGIDPSILYRSVAQPAIFEDYKFRPLSTTEPPPGCNTHCAIDAEFVRLLREEIDMGADGSRTITRPARSGLARVSVLRGDGLEPELPFIDDYIAIEEQVDDYLTQYSGLHLGDLTLGASRFTLVSLKEVYKKLWVLLNLGCKFIGHGLSSDFRTINIHVPESQVIDTQDLFSLGHRSQRKLSLRFLAWVVLNEDIQQSVVMGHDSIEDARTAYKLWRKYLEYEDAGVLESVKDDLLQKGRKMDFKVPLADGRRLPETPRTSAPSTPIRRPVSMVRMSTPARSDFGSLLK
ncbi:poly(A)-specific ribonuclease [Teratosphaeriaceae sp. CCFEE 6253]|nr:poly(A)-specific ribonuclease [Teratosphaeriaceae sp. CCFEE 6253]